MNLTQAREIKISMEEWRGPVGSAAVVATVLQFLSGMLVCKQYVVNRTTSESSPLPFICGFVSCALWLEYGILKQDDKIILVNTVGGVLSLAYTFVFYLYTIKKSAVLKLVTSVIAFLIFVIIYSCYEVDSQLLLKRLGLLACSLTLMFIAAPLSKLFYVMKVKNTECLPFPMILMGFVVSLLWFLYGMVTEDPFIQISNFIGCALAAFQLSLFVIYPERGVSSVAKSLLA